MVKFAYYGDNRWNDREFLPEHKPAQADAEYAKQTAEIVRLTGHENIMDADGKLISRAEREQNYYDSLVYLNRHIKLGLEEKDIQILTLVYTALSEVPRFGGDSHMQPVKGENTGTHSLHTPIRSAKLISKALDRLGHKDDRESVIIRQLTGLCLMPHDMGETLGEPGSLAQEVSNAHTGFKKDKPAAERLVLNAMLRLAAHAVEKGDPSIFYNRLDQLRMPDMSAQNAAKNNEQFLEMIREHLGVAPEIGAESEGRVAILRDFWRMQEEREIPDRFLGDPNLNGKFISLLASLCEHVQGTGHYNKFCTTNKRSDLSGNTVPSELAQSARMMANFKYCEGEVGDLFANAKTDTEKAIAIEAKREVYTKIIDLLSQGPAVIDRNATNLSELKPNEPGRAQEIALNLKRSKAEGELQKAHGTPDAIRNIETRDRMIKIYEWGREHDDFIPQSGQLLGVNPPEAFQSQAVGAVARLVKDGATDVDAPPRRAKQ